VCALEESVGERDTHKYTVLLFTRKGKRQKEGNPQLKLLYSRVNSLVSHTQILYKKKLRFNFYARLIFSYLSIPRFVNFEP